MEVTSELVGHIAKLARLNLTKEETDRFTPQLKEILEAFSRLDEVPTEGIPPSFHPVELKDFCRDDVTGKCLPSEDALRNTGHRKDSYFKGPRAV